MKHAVSRSGPFLPARLSATHLTRNIIVTPLPGAWSAYPVACAATARSALVNTLVAFRATPLLFANPDGVLLGGELDPEVAARWQTRADDCRSLVADIFGTCDVTSLHRTLVTLLTASFRPSKSPSPATLAGVVTADLLALLDATFPPPAIGFPPSNWWSRGTKALSAESPLNPKDLAIEMLKLGGEIHYETPAWAAGPIQPASAPVGSTNAVAALKGISEKLHFAAMRLAYRLAEQRPVELALTEAGAAFHHVALSVSHQ